MNDQQILKEFVKAIVLESLVREIDVTSGKTTFGSDEHISDLQTRIRDLTMWRDRQRKGSEARANYARLITRLRSELKSAERKRSKTKGA